MEKGFLSNSRTIDERNLLKMIPNALKDLKMNIIIQGV